MHQTYIIVDIIIDATTLRMRETSGSFGDESPSLVSLGNSLLFDPDDCVGHAKQELLVGDIVLETDGDSVVFCSEI